MIGLRSRDSRRGVGSTTSINVLGSPLQVIAEILCCNTGAGNLPFPARGCAARRPGGRREFLMVSSVLIDFDGTVTLEDTTDLLLERFADPHWHQIEAE